jgi:ribonuclease J
MTSVTVYDGSRTIGGNKIFIEDKDGGVFLDFGMNFRKYDVFFQEFLSERSSRGIHDLIHLDLIPKLNIYRKDLIPLDLDVTKYSTLKAKAVLLSHAHLDHCGNIGLLREDLPIVASRTSVAILKALRDTSPSSIGSEISYFSRKSPVEGCNGLVLESDTRLPYVSRDFCCTTDASEELREFACERSLQNVRSRKIEKGRLVDLNSLDLPFDVEAYEVDHSIYGAVGYVLKGDVSVAYTGDFRLHGHGAEKTRHFIKNARSASILIVEGTRIGRGEETDVTEEEVFNNCLEAIEKSDQLAVADFSARNFERLDTFVEIAKRTGKRAVVTAKDAYMLYAISCTEKNCRMDDQEILIYNELKNKKRFRWETEVVMRKWSDRYVSHRQISSAPEEYILCFSFFDLKHLLDVKRKGGVYVYSSSEAFSEEQALDFRRLNAWLDFYELTPYGFAMVGTDSALRPRFTKGYHASGHASRTEIERVIDEIDPDVIIPVHTEDPSWFEKAFDKTMLLKEGKRQEL